VALSNSIRKLRFKNNEMTQKRLAELVGVSRQTMNAIENSKHAPRVDVAIRIADVFDVSVDQLFGRDHDGKPKRSSIDTRTTTTRKISSIEISPDDNAEHGATDKKVESKTSLADLRDMF